ncbi:MAG TPA: YciI family protein [Chitinophagaceae bacterium]|nr:YciI family protein [Chitinophagaceae bacterium]
MQFFVIDLTYKASLDLIDKYLDKHRAFLDTFYESGNFLLSGRKIPRNGGLILACFQNREEALAAVKKDPFFSLGIASYQIVAFQPTKMIAPWETAVREQLSGIPN